MGVKDFEFMLYSKSAMPNKLLLNLSPYFNEGTGKSIVGVSISARHAPQDREAKNVDDIIEKASVVLRGNLDVVKKGEEFCNSTATTAAPTLEDLPVLYAF